MPTELVSLSLLSIVSLLSFFIFLLTSKFSNKIGNGILLDRDFEKPQAFHKELVPRSGGLAGIISLTIFFILYYFLFEEFGRPILNFYHYYSQFEQLQTEYNKWGAWAVFVAGVSPFPYKVITILSGAIELNLFTFVIASVLARGLRFFVLAWLLWHFGDTVQDFIKRRLGILFTLFCVLLVGGFVIIKLI